MRGLRAPRGVETRLRAPAGSARDASGSVLGCKLVTLFPHNTDRPTHQAVIALFDPATGTPVALMDGTHVTATRTAGAAALAARLLARPDARSLPASTYSSRNR